MGRRRSAHAFLAMAMTGALAAASVLRVEPADADSPVAGLISEARSYESGQSMQPLRQLEELARQSSTDPGLRRKLESGLVSLLTGQATFEAKQFASQQLSTIGTEDSLPSLAELLKDEGTVSLACRVLSTHPSSKASEVLRQALRTAPGATRAPIIHTLASRQDIEAVSLLIGLINDSDRATAEAAIVALGKIANEPARSAIARLRHASSPELARAVAEASMNAAEKLISEGDSSGAVAVYEDLLQSSQPDNVRRGAFEALLQLDEDGGERRILETLRGTDALLKPVAIAGVRRLRSERASETFARALPLLPPQEQVWLLEILATRGHAAAQAAVQASLRSDAMAVRLAAIEATSRSGGATSVPVLASLLAATHVRNERMALEKALTLLPSGADVDQAIVNALQQAPNALKSMLISILAKRESRAAVPAILACTRDPETAEAAFRALAGLAVEEDVPALIERLMNLEVPDARSDAESAVAQALLKISDPARRADAVLRELPRAKDVEARKSLVRLLPFSPSDEALTVLVAAVNGQDLALRDAAVRALVDWPDPRAWEPLANVYSHSTSDLHRALSLNALVRLTEEQNPRPDGRLIARYRELLSGAKSDSDRKRILGALSGVAHPDALGMALALMKSPAVRAEAELAVKRIAAAIAKEHPDAAANALR